MFSLIKSYSVLMSNLVFGRYLFFSRQNTITTRSDGFSHSPTILIGAPSDTNKRKGTSGRGVRGEQTALNSWLFMWAAEKRREKVSWGQTGEQGEVRLGEHFLSPWPARSLQLIHCYSRLLLLGWGHYLLYYIKLLASLRVLMTYKVIT